MLNQPRESQSVMLSVQVYQKLLAAYPRQFRREFGAAMVQVFRDACRRASREGGVVGMLTLWALTAVDYLKTVIEENSRGATQMTREKFYKLSGWAMMLGPILFLIGGWASSRPTYSEYNAASMPIDRYAPDAAPVLMAAGVLFMSLGILGMLLRYTQKWDAARIILGIGFLAGLVSAVGAAGLMVTDSDPWWSLWIFGLFIQYLAVAIFGFINLRQRLLPRWNGLPLLAWWFPVAMLLSSGVGPNAWELTTQIFTVLWILSIVMFAGFGFLLQSNLQPASPAAA